MRPIQKRRRIGLFRSSASSTLRSSARRPATPRGRARRGCGEGARARRSRAPAAASASPPARTRSGSLCGCRGRRRRGRRAARGGRSGTSPRSTGRGRARRRSPRSPPRRRAPRDGPARARRRARAGEVADVLDLAAGEAGAAQVGLARLEQLLRAPACCRRRRRARAGRSSAPLWSRAAGRRSPAAAPRRRRPGAPRCAASAASQVDLADPLDQRRHRRVRRRRALCAPWRSPAPSTAAGASRRRRGCPRGSPPRRSRTRAGRPGRPPAASLRIGRALSSSIACLLPRIESGALAAISAASATDSRSRRSSSTTSLTRPICSARAASKLRPVRNSSLVRASADRVEELAQPGVAVDQAELGRRHPQLGAGGADPQVAGDRQLEAAAEAVAVDRRHGRPGMGGDRLHRGVEGVGDERLGVALEGLLGDRGDVVAGGEDRRRAGDQDAAGLDPVVEPGQRLGHRVEDLVVERVAPLGVGDA